MVQAKGVTAPYRSTRACERALARLDRHHSVRLNGVPRPSVLAGPDGAALWRRWARRRGLPCEEIAADSAVTACRTYIERVASTRDLLADLARVAAPVGTAEPAQLAGRWRRASGSERAAAAAAIAGADLALDVRRLGAALLEGRLELEPSALIAGLAALVPVAELPALLIRLAPSADLLATADELMELASAAPAVPMAIVAADERELTAALAARHRASAALRQGLVHEGEGSGEVPRLEPGSNDGNTGRNRAAFAANARPPDVGDRNAVHTETGSGAVDSQIDAELKAARSRLVEGGAAAAVLARFDAAASARIAMGENDQGPGAVERARSAAERLLYEELESAPETRGMFRLNAAMPFAFGNRRAEIDLLADEIALAVEVDGYFHFADWDAYRRDRRKDLLLQQHRLTIVRVLADDVIMRLDEVTDLIRTAIGGCRHHGERNP